jgi:TusA-related sulfurtransferase
VKNLAVALLSITSLFVGSIVAQDPKPDTKKDDSMQNCPMHQQHAKAESHHDIVEKHGDQAMGFPHDRTTHHFLLNPQGGTIEVNANDPGDKANTEAIRSHLSHIAVVFATGDFSTPMFVHDSVPPGVTTMQLLKAAVRYRYEEIPSGGRVRIESTDPVAVAAVHDFLRFQISEHQTADRMEVDAH